MERFHKSNFETIVTSLCQKDNDLAGIVARHGMPPMWIRPNNFATLVLTILEQQVSIAAAFAAYKKLEAYIGEPTPEKILALSDEELRACYFTRQKTGYVRGLATAIQTGAVNLQRYETLADDAVRHELIQLKGIGHWTVDIYLLHALHRTDIFPIGDIALVNALKDIKGLDKQTPKETLIEIAEPWRPYRSIATMLLWHHYLSKRKPIQDPTSHPL
ncbi:DNA-3-methyladenine glycosylase II [Cnuella takakiae]|uniref:DNA-3-methyladenine glycosylase II n=2 Tax=Cnuella takakiae TaxID=1302690 RepID=A0A1M5H9I7_9BACT|nr:DNA-3-methyladenine glycosylase II [Cnuella takakiae]